MDRKSQREKDENGFSLKSLYLYVGARRTHNMIINFHSTQ